MKTCHSRRHFNPCSPFFFYQKERKKRYAIFGYLIIPPPPPLFLFWLLFIISCLKFKRTRYPSYGAIYAKKGHIKNRKMEWYISSGHACVCLDLSIRIVFSKDMAKVKCSLTV